MKKLETKMPNYSQNVADLQESALFDRISLSSVNGRLIVQARCFMFYVCSPSDVAIQSVAFEVGQFSSLNGEIDGHFDARSSLNLHTLNGRITPTVNLSYREGADPSNLAIHTLNGYVIPFLSCAVGN